MIPNPSKSILSILGVWVDVHMKTLEITFFLVEKQIKLKYVFYEPRSSSNLSMLILI